MNLAVLPGDCYGFIGPNGAGKTTTLRAVVGVMDFDEGEIRIAGHDVRREPIACKAVTAYIPDNPTFINFSPACSISISLRISSTWPTARKKSGVTPARLRLRSI